MNLFTGGNDAGELRSYLNQLVIALNGLIFNNAIIYPDNACTLFQMKTVLLAISDASLLDVVNIIPADPVDPVNVQWTSCGLVQEGDALYELIRTTLGLTNNQMLALIALARTLPA